MAWNSLILDKTAGKISKIDEDNFETELNNGGNNTKVDYLDDNPDNDYSVTFKDTTHEYIVDKNGKITLKGIKVIEENNDSITKLDFANATVYNTDGFTNSSSSTGNYLITTKSGCEKLNIPIINCTTGNAYRLTFELQIPNVELSASNSYGFFISETETTTNSNSNCTVNLQENASINSYNIDFIAKNSTMYLVFDFSKLKDGKKYNILINNENIKESEVWVFPRDDEENESFIASAKNQSLGVVRDREFKKTNDGDAICAFVYVNGYLGPFMVSTNRDAALYDGGGISGSLFYQGQEYYYTNCAYFMPISSTYSTDYQTLNSKETQYQNSQDAQIALKLLDIYFKDYNNSLPKFDVSSEIINDNESKVSISNIRYERTLNNWIVKYRNKDTDDWQTSNNLTFNIIGMGSYKIKIVCDNIESKEKRIYVGNNIELAYIKFNSGSYIDTGIIPTNHTTEIKFDFGTYDNDEHLFGTNRSNSHTYYHFTAFSNKYYWGRNGSETSAGNWSAGVHTLIFNGENNSVVLDNKNLGSGTNILSSANLLLGNRGGTANLQASIYYLKIIDKSTGNLVRDLVPVYNKKINSVGMYDKIENKFYGNRGTGNFTAGPEKQ